jgi:hypothetical protein
MGNRLSMGGGLFRPDDQGFARRAISQDLVNVADVCGNRILIHRRDGKMQTLRQRPACVSATSRAAWSVSKGINLVSSERFHLSIADPLKLTACKLYRTS